MQDLRSFFGKPGKGGAQKPSSKTQEKNTMKSPGKRSRPTSALLSSAAATSAAAYFGGDPAKAPESIASPSRHDQAVQLSEATSPIAQMDAKEVPKVKKRRVDSVQPAPRSAAVAEASGSTSPRSQRTGTRAAVIDSDDDYDDERSSSPAAPLRTAAVSPPQNHGGLLARSSPKIKKAKANTKSKEAKRKSPGFIGERQGIEDDLIEALSREAIERAAEAFRDGTPVGHHLALRGDRFVFTGEDSMLEREELEEFCRLNGGRVMTAVSSTTFALVAGEQLEDGRQVQQGKKWEAAEEKNVAVWSVARFIQETLKQAMKEEKDKSVAASFAAAGAQVSSARAPAPVAPRGSKAARRPTPAHKATASDNGGAKRASVAEQRSDATQSLWADRFAPSDEEDLVGHATNFAKLRSWLDLWDERHIRMDAGAAGGGGKGGQRKGLYPPVDKARDSEQPEKRAVLISGPPGIGKTTAAHLAAKVCRREVFELNASDTRSKRGLRERLGDVIGTQVLAWHGKSLDGSVKTTKAARRVIIMDEVDGLGASDRGGNAELIQIIKKTRTPIICLCNDRQKSSVRSLANNCFDLKFMRPQKGAIAKAMVPIAKQAGLDVDVVTMEQIAESCGNDMRQVLGMLQMQARTRSTLTYADFSQERKSISKDEALRHTAFTALPTMFSRGVTVRERYEAFFVDYDLLPLMVAQSYPASVLSSGSTEGAMSRLQRLSHASESCSDGDIVARKVRMRQQWQLLPSQAAFNVRGAWYATGRVQPNFPDWLGRNSARNKRSRLLSELTVHMSGRVSGGLRAVRLDYAPAMLRLLMHPLALDQIQAATAGIESGAISMEDVAAASGSKKPIKGKPKKTAAATAAATMCAHQAITNMDLYGLSREDVVETLPELALGSGESMWQSLDSKSKAAFTRAYNSRAHKSQGLHVAGKSAPAGSTKRGKTGGMAFARGKGKGGGASPAAEQDDEDEDDDAMDEGAALEAGMLGVE